MQKCCHAQLQDGLDDRGGEQIRLSLGKGVSGALNEQKPAHGRTLSADNDGSEIRLRRWPLVEMLEQPAEALLAPDSLGNALGRWWFDARDEDVTDALVWPVRIVKVLEFSKDVSQVGFAKNDEVVEAFVLDGSYPSFREGVEVRSARTNRH